ncbi:MAG: hypothetical protein R2852_04685 [Bacteroidia bacterium]
MINHCCETLNCKGQVQEKVLGDQRVLTKTFEITVKYEDVSFGISKSKIKYPFLKTQILKSHYWTMIRPYNEVTGKLLWNLDIKSKAVKS